MMYTKIATGVVVIGGLAYYLYESKKAVKATLPPSEDKILEAFKVDKGMAEYEQEDMLADIAARTCRRLS